MDIMSKVRENEPLIHCMTHAITMNDSANAILAVGGSPTMASHPQEVEEIVAAADSLVVNLGNINEERLEAMKIAGEKAQEKGIPILLDAVGGLRTPSGVRSAVRRDSRPRSSRGTVGDPQISLRPFPSGPRRDAGAADATQGEFAADARLFGSRPAARGGALVTGLLVTDGETALGIANGNRQSHRHRLHGGGSGRHLTPVDLPGCGGSGTCPGDRRGRSCPRPPGPGDLPHPPAGCPVHPTWGSRWLGREAAGSRIKKKKQEKETPLRRVLLFVL